MYVCVYIIIFIYIYMYAYIYIYYVLPPAKCIQVCHDHLRTQTSKSFCPGRPGQFEASSTHQSFAKNKRITLEQ